MKLFRKIIVKIIMERLLQSDYYEKRLLLKKINMKIIIKKDYYEDYYKERLL